LRVLWQLHHVFDGVVALLLSKVFAVEIGSMAQKVLLKPEWSLLRTD
jgi:hypothetical protein